MATMKPWILGLLLALLAGCSAFEQTPQDLQHKLMNDSTKGHLYERDPLQNY
jgi:hypothetical protein